MSKAPVAPLRCSAGREPSGRVSTIELEVGTPAIRCSAGGVDPEAGDALHRPVAHHVLAVAADREAVEPELGAGDHRRPGRA